MATQLGLYQAAEIELGTSTVNALTDDVKVRHDLDSVYTRVLADCLKEANWKFATKTDSLDSAGTPTVHDYNYYFTQPSDWVRTVSLSGYGNFYPPLDKFEFEGGRWYTSVDPLYIRYVSNDSSFGGDLTAWPAHYTRYVELALAARVCMTVTGSRSLLNDLKSELRLAKSNAKSADAVEGPARYFPDGAWVRSRGGGIGLTRHDRQDP